MLTGIKILAMWKNPKASKLLRELLEAEGVMVREMTVVESCEYEIAINIMADNEKQLKAIEGDYLFLEAGRTFPYAYRARHNQMGREHENTEFHDGERGE